MISESERRPRWIVLSGLSADARAGHFALTTALHLSTQKTVLFWDVDSSWVPSAREFNRILPYRRSLLPVLLRNYLRYESGPVCALRGSVPAHLEDSPATLQWMKCNFDIVIVAAEPSWDASYLSLLDVADLLALLPGTAQDPAPHYEKLATHKFPKALARVIPCAARQFAEQIVSDATLYCATGLGSEEMARHAKTRIHERLIKEKAAQAQDSKLDTRETLETLIAEDTVLPASREVRERMLDDLMNDVLGLGPIEPLLKDPEISEVMVNGGQTVFVEKQGRLHPTSVRFENDAHLRTVIDRIVAPLGRRVDESTPLCDARLADGSRVNIVLPPLALDGATLTIRKFMQKRLSLGDLIQRGALSPAMGDFLIRCVQARKNILISGGTGSGKTTLLNILSGCIANDERIVTIEDAAELKLQQPHVVRLESRPPNAEGEGAISIRRLVINALRMRPDRLVVGECRGGEALDMLQAMNTGHDGSLTTLHANSPRDALGRLEALVLMAGMDLPIRVVREQIRSAVHILVQTARLADGSRRITSLTELTGMEGDVLTTSELFRFRSGHFESTGVVSQMIRS